MHRWTEERRPTVEHHRSSLGDLGHVARLLSQLADRRLLRRLSLVDQAGRDFDADLVNGGSKLLLEHDFGA